MPASSQHSDESSSSRDSSEPPQPPPPQPLPWYSPLTIDLIVHSANRTILQPFFAWMLPLSLIAITIPFSHLSVKLTTAYAALLTLWALLDRWNTRIAHGKPRKMEREIVLITGGKNGLGKAIADFYVKKGDTVIVLDLMEEVNAEANIDDEEPEHGPKYFHCNVGDHDEVFDVCEKIVDTIGTPTVLVNNAAILNRIPIFQMSPKNLQKGVNVNFLSHFYTVRNIVPYMMLQRRGTIVTVSSVLGYAGSAWLSEYCASKAALLAFHQSLKAELALLGQSEIKTILVAPGQISTRLFEDVQTPNHFLAPVLDTVELAREIVQLIDSGMGGQICMPLYTKWVPLVPFLPGALQYFFRYLSGIDEAASSTAPTGYTWGR